MPLTAQRTLPLAATVLLNCVCCAGILDYGDLTFDDHPGKSSWNPSDGSSIYEVSSQDVPPPLNPQCDQLSLALVGDLEGTAANECYPTISHAVNQTGTPPQMDMEFGTEGAVHLEWTGLLANGMSTPAKGTLKMPAEGPNAGLTYCIDDGTFAMFEVAMGSRVYTFSATKLSRGTSCPGTPALGSVRGDYRTQ